MCNLCHALHLEGVFGPDRDNRFSKPEPEIGVAPLRTKHRKRDPVAKVGCLPPAYEICFLFGQIGEFLDLGPQERPGQSGRKSGYRVDDLQIRVDVFADPFFGESILDKARSPPRKVLGVVQMIADHLYATIVEKRDNGPPEARGIRCSRAVLYETPDRCLGHRSSRSLRYSTRFCDISRLKTAVKPQFNGGKGSCPALQRLAACPETKVT